MLVPISVRPLAVALLVFLAGLGACLALPSGQFLCWLPPAVSGSLFPPISWRMTLIPHLNPLRVGYSSPPGQLEFAQALL